MDFKDTARWFCSQAGVATYAEAKPYHAPIHRAPAKRGVKPLGAVELPTLHQGLDEELAAVAVSRGILFEAVKIASDSGCLVFGKSCGFDCWILTDASRAVAEARRIDGEPFPSIGSLGARKAHTLKGSSKSWPVGIQPDDNYLYPHNGLLLVEGGPDYLAALHFQCLASFANSKKGMGFVPVAMLGRGPSIHPDALPLFANRRIRIFPHHDKDGGGVASAQKWAEDIHAAGASEIDFFTFEDLEQPDGKAVSDLNDAALCRPEDQHKLNEVLPTHNQLTSCL